MKRFVIIAVILVTALVFAKFQAPDDDKKKESVSDSKLWLKEDIKTDSKKAKAPEDELTEQEKAEIKAAELEYQKEELEKQIQAELEKIETEKLELKNNEDELLRLTEEIASDAEYELIQADADSLTSEEKFLLEEAEREYNKAEADSLNAERISNNELLNESIIEKNKLVSSAALGIRLYNEPESKNSAKILDIPHFSHRFTAVPNRILKIFLNSDFGFRMEKITDGGKNYENDIYLFIDPAVKVNVFQPYFLKFGLPFYFDRITLQGENSDDYNISLLNFSVSGGYDSRTEDIHLLSPWNEFEEGLLGEIKYTSGIFQSSDGKSYKELTSKIDAILSFSMLYGNYNLMLKPYVLYEYEMNDKIEDPVWLTTGVFYAWDKSEDINFNGFMNIKYGQIDPDNGTDLWGTETFLQGGLAMNSYITNELDLFSEISFNQLLFADKDADDGNGIQEDDPEITIRLGLKYITDFRK